ncbi:MAG: S41 family peptidase [Candidatus Zixiibacteriota bacterium]
MKLAGLTRSKRLLLAVALAILLCVAAVSGQVIIRGDQPGPTVDDAIQLEIIDSIAYALNEVYVFPEVAKEMEKHLRKQYHNKAYKNLTALNQFTEKLTEDMREISHDLHLGIRYLPADMIIQDDRDTLSDEEQLIRLKRELEYNNFAFEKVERLPGNVGYLKMNGFNDANFAGRTAIAALNFLAYCDALIIDLRDNGGGSPSMIQLITSYFFDEPKHLNSFYIRKEDSIQQFWTQAYVEGPRMSDVDLYVLTSSYTFSAAEEFTYNLKNMERATIVGETTGGGAHPVTRRRFNNLNVVISLPYGRAINPISGTNWEGKGVEPHITTTYDQAFDMAYLEALKKLLEKETNENIKNRLTWKITDLEAKLNPFEISEAVLREYVGTYGPRKVTLDNGSLLYQREDRPKYRMVPMADNLFRFEDLEYFRARFERDQNGTVIKFVGVYDNGQTDENMKDN